MASGSEFGKILRLTTWGESHGAGIGAVLDGFPAGMDLSEEDIQKYLDRRKPGQSEISTPRKESDRVEILSGVFDGKTTGTPISLLIRNTSQGITAISKTASDPDTLITPITANSASVITAAAGAQVPERRPVVSRPAPLHPNSSGNLVWISARLPKRSGRFRSMKNVLTKI